MISIYRFITTLIYPLLIFVIFLRKVLKKEDHKRYKEKIFSSYFNVIRKENSKLIWFHAASIGELKSIFPILNELNKENKNFEFLITTVTLSAGNLAKKEINKYTNVQHRFFPLDINFLIKKFLLRWQPNIIFLVDSEIWPNLILNANQSKIPIALINGRITKKTFKKWKFFKEISKKIFGSFGLCLSSSVETKTYLEELGAKNIFHLGNIKLFSRNTSKETNDPNEIFLSKIKHWCVVSSHRGEEKFCLDTHKILKKNIKNILTIIAPRHINRANEIKKLCDEHNLDSQILTNDQKIQEGKEIIIINTFGILSKFFKNTKSVFMGKSLFKKFVYEGGQNPIEAAQQGCKIYHGPFICNFKEIYNILRENLISQEINDSGELASYINKDFEEKIDSVQISNLIQNLGQKTLTDTMRQINFFLKNETI